MKTRITDMFSIDVPVFAFSHCRDVVVEVSRAGGMGVLGIAGFSPERLEEELNWIDAHIEGRPYGVDILIPSSYDRSGATPRTLQELQEMIPGAHQNFSAQVCEQAGVSPLNEEGKRQLEANLNKTHMTPESAEELVVVALRHPIKLMVNALGTPPKERVDELHARGIRVGALAGKLEHARAQVEAGVDLIVAQGTEAGGHTGKISSMVLWPQVVDAVAPVPVLAAGGIGRGRQMAAALALGAEGVWCGSIWLGTRESEVPPALRERLYGASSDAAIQSRSMTGKPCRMLRSKYSDAWDAPGAPAPLPMPLQTLATAEMRLRIDKSNAADYMSYPVGQIVGDMKHESSVRQVIYDMLEELLTASERLNAVITGE